MGQVGTTCIQVGIQVLNKIVSIVGYNAWITLEFV